MAPRSQWNGYLKLSLVSCPISLYPAVSAAEKISFRQVNRETGHRLRQQLVDSVTGKVVESHERGRGYEVGEDQFVLVGDEELKEAQREARTRPFSNPAARQTAPLLDQPPERSPIKGNEARRTREPLPERVAVSPAPPPTPRPQPENTHTIELDRFLVRDEIDPRYYLAPYYVAPRDEVGQEAFALIREAMARRDLVGMGRVVLANRERPIIVEPMGLGLRAFTLHYSHEVRSEADYFTGILPLELPDNLLEVTDLILDSKKGSFDPAYLEDRYRTVLVEKLRDKQSKLPLRATPTTPSARNVINLMDALKASLATAKPPAPSRSRAATKRTGAVADKAKPAKRRQNG